MAAVDYFIKFDGIKGESADAKHKDEIDVESWSWAETHAVAPSGGGGAGKVSMQDFHFVMRLNRASPGLMKACATGQHIKTATLSGRKAGKDLHVLQLVELRSLIASRSRSARPSFRWIATSSLSPARLRPVICCVRFRRSSVSGPQRRRQAHRMARLTQRAASP